MRLRRFSAALSTAGLVAILGGASGVVAQAAAATGSNSINLSTNQAVSAYLTSVGVDPGTVTIQRGSRNYAGPNCPGAGWNCTTATKVVQVAGPGGINTAECDPAIFSAGFRIPDSYLTKVLTASDVASLTSGVTGFGLLNGCVAIQQASTNTMRCVMRNGEVPAAVQNCLIIQPGASGDPDASNRAFVLLMIDQNSGSTQDGTQRVRIEQNAMGAAKNFAHVIEYIKQSTKGGPAQVQEGHQLACVVQKSVAGSNFSQIIQSDAAKAVMSGVADQSQNLAVRPEKCHEDDAAPVSSRNTFALVSQDSSLTAGGPNESHVNQSHNLDARATGTAVLGTQTQGAPTLTAGLEGIVTQNSSALSKSFSVQNEDQNLSGNSPTITQRQFGPIRCCAEQADNPNDDAKIEQMSAQRAVTSTTGDILLAVTNPHALQETLLQGNCVTTGTCTVAHKASQNGGSNTARCPPQGEPPSSACALVTFGLNGTFFAEFPPPICDEGEFFDPETGKCEDILT